MESTGPQLDRPPDWNGAFAGADYVLAGRIWSGDVEALGELFDRHGAAALATATALVADSALAEDIVHDAFVTVWQTIGEFDSSADSLVSWVLALTRRVAAQRLPAGIADDRQFG